MLQTHRFFVGKSLVVFNHRSQKRGDVIHHADIGIFKSPLVFFTEHEITFEVFPGLQRQEVERIVFVGSEYFSSARYLAGSSFRWYFAGGLLVDRPDRRESGVVFMDKKTRNSRMLLH